MPIDNQSALAALQTLVEGPTPTATEPDRCSDPDCWCQTPAALDPIRQSLKDAIVEFQKANVGTPAPDDTEDVEAWLDANPDCDCQECQEARASCDCDECQEERATAADPGCGCEDCQPDLFHCGYCGCPCGSEYSLYEEDRKGACGCGQSKFAGDDLEPEEQTEEEAHLEVLDALGDLLTGIDQWKRAKVAGGVWEGEDEQLYRWISGSPHAIVEELTT